MHAKHWLSALGLAAFLASAPARAGALADVSVIDRATGQALPVYFHQGRHWVEGVPGSRYAVRVVNRTGERLLSVIAVDGVNVVSGETAGVEQNGYVFGPGEAYDVTGWRKSRAEVAAFHFTTLAQSYAARTGRPGDVGVIGVALFRERMAAPPLGVAPANRPWFGRDERGLPEMRENAEAGRAAAPPAQEMAKADSAMRRPPASGAGGNVASAPPADTRLGTGHGQPEASMVGTTSFQRARSAPDEVIAIHYDSRANLVAMGVLREPRPAPRPFPGQPELGFVPDPPR
jgi:hypothetical protein